MAIAVDTTEGAGKPPARFGAGLFRYGPSDALFVLLAAVHGAALLAFPSLLLVALGLWWNSNTISHNFIHRPFFRRGLPNRALSLYLTLVLGYPQELWRRRHLAHHAGRPVRLRPLRRLRAK